jgi:enoyl-CoA hydratase
MMGYQTLIVDLQEGVATVTINRPAKLNALNALTKQELREAFDVLCDDDGIGAIVLTGAGDKAFVAGTDIEELQALDQAGGEEFSRGGQNVFDAIERCGKPVIAAVNGYALGGGCELAMACTLRVASEKARFGQPEINLGVIPGYGGTQRLPRLVGKGKALELMLTGAPIPAEEALRVGLVNVVVPHDELAAAAARIAGLLAGKSRSAIHAIIEAIRASEEGTAADGMKREAELFGACVASADGKEGVRAFIEKRPALFNQL